MHLPSLLCRSSRRVFSESRSFFSFQSLWRARIALTKPALRSSLRFPNDSPEGLPSNFVKLLRATGFCITVSGISYVGCSIWNYESVRNKLRLSSISENFTQKFFSGRNQINQLWNEMSDGKKLILGIVVVNCVVLILWQMRSCQALMSRYFLSDPNAKRIGPPMLFSMFSHSAPFHLLCNMYVLWSFSDATLHIFGKEQFLFFYISAGLFSCLLSTANKFARVIRQPSLGASGAIIAALAAVCTTFPESKLSIIFLPMFPFTADSALKFLVAFEALGVLLKWRYFDHAAHLGGILFGIWYVKYGHSLTWGHRKPIVEWWHKLRSGNDPRK